ncbi:hypothetical protein Tco_1522794, partial [Tanacetum coccineum]
KVGKVAYRLELPQELSRVHHTFNVSNLKKCYADEPLAMSLEGIHVDDKLQFVEEPVEIMEREIKRLKRSRIPLVKVRWNSRRGPEFTWEREDSFKQKYPQLFTNRASPSTTRGLPTKVNKARVTPLDIQYSAATQIGGVTPNIEKKTTLAISTIEAEYVSAGKACKQALWMKQALVDYDIRLDDIPIMCDNKGAIELSKNPVQHSRTKHIEIRHHFLRDNV